MQGKTPRRQTGATGEAARWAKSPVRSNLAARYNTVSERLQTVPLKSQHHLVQ